MGINKKIRKIIEAMPSLPEPKDLKRYLEAARRAALKAGRVVLQGSAAVTGIEYKGEVDMVTDVDRKAQDIVASILASQFPEHGLRAEEKLSRPARSAFCWVIDPVDGTTNLVHGYPTFCVSVGLLFEGLPCAGAVYNPCRDEMFTALAGGGAFLNEKAIGVSSVSRLERSLIGTGFSYDMREKKTHLEAYLSLFRRVLERAQGVRRDGAAALDLCSVACGRLDAFFEEGLKEWDVAAGAVILREAGGRLTDFYGTDTRDDVSTVLASNGLLHASLLEMTSGFASVEKYLSSPDAAGNHGPA